MYIQEVVCPNCGEIALVNVPDIKWASSGMYYPDTDSIGTCRHCKKRIQCTLHSDDAKEYKITDIKSYS